MRHAIWMLGLSLALSGLAARADEAQAPVPQPEVPVAPTERAQAQPESVVAKLDADGKLVFKAQDGRVVDFVREVLAHGELQVLVDNAIRRTGVIHSIKPTLESALRRRCYHNDLEVLTDGDAFLVRFPRVDAPEPLARANGTYRYLHFEKVQVGYMVEQLVVGSGGGIVVEIEDDLSDKVIPEIKLDNVTLKPALEAVALAVDAQLDWEEGRYILSAKPK